MKRILITGANSYIGTSFANHLAQWPDDYQVDTIDMRDGSWREKSFSTYDTVYHVAGIAHSDVGRISKERIAFYYKVNTDLAIETAQKARKDGVKQFIFMSSAIVYGESAPIGKEKIITRDTPPSPANSYGDSKLKAEQGIQKLGDDAFSVVILRTPMVYGEGCKGNYPTLVKIALKLPMFPRVNNQKSMLYIGNLVEFVRLMIDNEESGLFWPQNAEYVNTSEMVKMIAQNHKKAVVLISGLEWAVKCLSHFTGVVNKAFGNFVYCEDLSRYKDRYQIVDLEESIRRIESDYLWKHAAF